MLIGLDEVRRMWERVIDPNAYTNLFKDIGIVITDGIQQRTAAGIDYLKNTFSPYTEAYKKWKQRKGLYTGKVNLKVSGHMLGSLVSKPEPKQVEITFSNTKAMETAYYNEEGRKPRVFVSIPPDVEKQIDKMIDKRIDELLNG